MRREKCTTQQAKVVFSVARFRENSPFGGKMTFQWEFFSDPYVENGECLAKSLLSTWGILKFLMYVNGGIYGFFMGNFQKIIWQHWKFCNSSSTLANLLLGRH
jgi:hypothetical protein